MSLKDWLKRLAFVVPLSLGALSVSVATAEDGGCVGGSCGSSSGGSGKNCGPCPPPFIHYTPKVPCIRFKCTCGKPVCDICDMPGYGYYPTCWRPWDQPLNYNCPVPTPTQLVQPPEMLWPQEEVLPMPRIGDGLPRR